jgi:cell wall-associated NlpC family hydrolase
MLPEEIVGAARECLGAPFVHQGRSPSIGLDCIGLAAYVARKWYELDGIPAYSRMPNNHILEDEFEKVPFLRRVNGPQAGDILMMRFTGDPQHVAICAGDTIIHSYESIGRVVEHNLDDKWRKRIVRVYRFKDVE